MMNARRKRKIIRPILSFLFILCGNLTVFPQNHPSIAVIPLRALGAIKEAEANALTSLLETGLVKSSMFQVVEKGEISEVLAAQEFSFADYADKNFVIQVGKLLSAKQIVLGTISRIGIKYIITAKIIDVASGKTLKADKVNADSIENLASQAEILGYRLAGLNTNQNGISNQQVGRLFIRAAESNVLVYLDKDELGFIGDGLFADIPAGDHSLVLSGNGLYGQAEITIFPNQTTIVDAELVPVGTLHYKIPHGANAIIGGKNYSRTISGEGSIKHIPVGTYTIQTSHPDYLTSVESIQVDQGEIIELFPLLSPTPEFQAELEKNARRQKHGELFAERNFLAQRLERDLINSRRLSTASWIFYGFSAGLSAGTGATLILKLRASRQGACSQSERLGGISIGLGIAGCISAVIGTMLWLEKPNINTIREKLEQVERDITRLIANN